MLCFYINRDVWLFVLLGEDHATLATPAFRDFEYYFVPFVPQKRKCYNPDLSPAPPPQHFKNFVVYNRYLLNDLGRRILWVSSCEVYKNWHVILISAAIVFVFYKVQTEIIQIFPTNNLKTYQEFITHKIKWTTSEILHYSFASINKKWN